nr:hypothetical protein [uncultured Gemmiger sp.]
MGKKKLFPNEEKSKKPPVRGVRKKHGTVKIQNAGHHGRAELHVTVPPFLTFFTGVLHNFHYSTTPPFSCQGKEPGAGHRLWASLWKAFWAI